MRTRYSRNVRDWTPVTRGRGLRRATARRGELPANSLARKERRGAGGEGGGGRGGRGCARGVARRGGAFPSPRPPARPRPRGPAARSMWYIMSRSSPLSLICSPLALVCGFLYPVRARARRGGRGAARHVRAGERAGKREGQRARRGQGGGGRVACASAVVRVWEVGAADDGGCCGGSRARWRHPVLLTRHCRESLCCRARLCAPGRRPLMLTRVIGVRELQSARDQVS